MFYFNQTNKHHCNDASCNEENSRILLKGDYDNYNCWSTHGLPRRWKVLAGYLETLIKFKVLLIFEVRKAVAISG